MGASVEVRVGAAAAKAPEPAALDSAVRVARQPILDRASRLVGYELLFRGGIGMDADVLDDSAATSAVILDGFLDVGLTELVGGTKAFVNVSRDFLLDVRPLPLPPAEVVLEILEDQSADRELHAVLGELTRRRFTIALDDFRLTPDTEQLLPYARIVKVDVLEHQGDALTELLIRLKRHRPALTLLAEKVETHEDFERCRDLGFHYFQGYHFARPARLQHQRTPSLGIGALATMANLSSADGFEELHRVITRDAGLSMRLLRYANSAYLALPRRISSVKEGLSWLGTAAVRRFALMVALADAQGAPDQLLVTALLRARMCQMLAPPGQGAVGDMPFTTGLLSVADALANLHMADVLQQLPIHDEVAGALLHRSGELGRLLAGVVAYEHGDFQAAAPLIAYRPDVEQVHRQAIAWADMTVRELKLRSAPTR